MNNVYMQKYRLAALRDLVERGVFAVPQLQREFVWNAKKACDLLDSIVRGFPIGTLLVWRTTRKDESQLRRTLHILPPYQPANRELFFLIDGQQRLSVLWHLLRGHATAVENSSGNVVDFGHIYFNIWATEDEAWFIYRKRPSPEDAKRLCPAVDLLSPRWKKLTNHLGSRSIERITWCRDAILSYEAFVIFCQTSHLEEVRETFIRINSQGMKISSADRAFARASKIDLRDDVKDVLHRLQHGFKEISRETVLQAVSFALGGQDLGERAFDAMVKRLNQDEGARDEYRRMLQRLRGSFELATDYLVNELQVPNVDFLPSEPMVAILALYFFHNGGVRPPPMAKRALRRWFWATALGERYSGRGYRTHLVGDAAFMAKLAEKSATRAPLSLALPRYVLRATDYSRPGPRSNAFFILLRKQRPRYLEDGHEIPLGAISSRANRRDMHHVFPRSLLSKAGIPPDRANSILNICYLVARENQSIGQRSPRYYLDEVPTSHRARKLAMASHLLPDGQESGLWHSNTKRAFTTFLDQRTRLLVEAFEREAEMKLFERR